jgi:hypothetical protein
MKIQIHTKVEGGKVQRNKKAIRDAFAHFEGKEITVSVERKKKVRSDAQNKYYWSTVVTYWKQLIEEEHGEFLTASEVHEFLKANFNPIELMNQDTGEVLRLGKSTTENSTIEMEEFMERCRRGALEFFGAVIPLPNEQLELL